MNKLRIISLATGAAAFLTAAAASAYPGQNLASHAKITLAQARATAQRTAHGTIVSQELETEAGGSGLRYTFDVKTATGVREVGIDARTGAVLENAPETGGD